MLHILPDNALSDMAIVHRSTSSSPTPCVRMCTHAQINFCKLVQIILQTFKAKRFKEKLILIIKTHWKYFRIFSGVERTANLKFVKILWWQHESFAFIAMVYFQFHILKHFKIKNIQSLNHIQFYGPRLRLSVNYCKCPEIKTQLNMSNLSNAGHP